MNMEKGREGRESRESREGREGREGTEFTEFTEFTEGREFREDAEDLCNEFRKSLDLKKEGDAEIKAKMDLHETQCNACQRWQLHMSDLSRIAAELPQFDVSEALTQRILKGIEAEPAYGRSLAPTVLFLAALAVAPALVYFVESGETVAGLLSWGVGIAIMAFLKFLMGDPSKVADAA